MSTSHSYPLEVTQSLLNRARSADFRFGEDTALVAVQHMLLQSLDLFETVGAMGLDLKNCFALGKVYSNHPLVIEKLRALSVTVLDATVPLLGEFHDTFDRDVERLWEVAGEALAKRPIKRILILDDAGVCITKTPQEVLQRYTVAGVEQTSQGIFLFETTPPPFGVMSWARSAVKLVIGGPIFSQCFVEKFNEEFLHGVSPGGARVGIVGFGSIGRSVATLMMRQGAPLSIYDPDTAVQVPRSVRDQVVRLDSLEELMLRCDYIFGCSGRQPFEGKWPLRHRPSVSLLSASGGDQEFAAIIREAGDRFDITIDPATSDVTIASGPSGPIRIAYAGYPYNFVSRRPEAVPTRIVQLETGGLLAALIQARFFQDLCETGQIQNSGIHCVSPQAQCFVFENWLRTMTADNIDVAELFAIDPATLSAAHDEHWFAKNSEPHRNGYEPVTLIEDRMARLVRRGF